mgnify:CR=1 FL=1
MIKKILFLFICIFVSLSGYAQFGLYASAVYIKSNGSSAFYNNTAPGLGQDIGTLTFQGTDLGVFEQNSANLKITGSEVKTFKGPGDNVCSARLNFTVYPIGVRPVSPIYTAIDLGFYADCFAPACGAFFGSFPLVAGGGCCTAGDQKWQNPGSGIAADIDLTTFTPGSYTLEMYYSYTGEDGGAGCVTTKFDNNNNNPVNYTASFTISSTAPVSFGNIQVTNLQNRNKISWYTLSESETASFTLEHSLNGISFNSIGDIPAAGYSTTSKAYTLMHNDPNMGINYYRVRMNENGGRQQFSRVVKTSNNLPGHAYVNNNPVNNNLLVKNLSKGDVITLFNAYGANVYRTVAASGQLNIDANFYANGVYLLKIINKDSNVTLPVIIQH